MPRGESQSNLSSLDSPSFLSFQCVVDLIILLNQSNNGYPYSRVLFLLSCRADFWAFSLFFVGFCGFLWILGVWKGSGGVVRGFV